MPAAEVAEHQQAMLACTCPPQTVELSPGEARVLIELVHRVAGGDLWETLPPVARKLYRRVTPRFDTIVSPLLEAAEAAERAQLALKLASLTDHLADTGWDHLHDEWRASATWQHPATGRLATVPHEVLADFELRYFDAVEAIARAENRTPDDVEADLQTRRTTPADATNDTKEPR